ncbi:MAG: SMC-Scp complex subunit ScpB [Myxococcota bacterium]|nr:SMC-Scp complex subunit ScpB [Myxococcota bacterium]
MSRSKRVGASPEPLAPGQVAAHETIGASARDTVPGQDGAEITAEPDELGYMFDSPTVKDGPMAPVEDAEAGVEEASALSTTHLRGLLEALVFASDKPMKAGELARLASAPVKQVKAALEVLKASHADHGIVLGEVAGGWVFRTHAQYAPFVRELTSERPVRLTRAQMETLAITAYRQPITRPEIDEIRGVDSGATLKLLLERDLVRILGKKDEPGRPILYGTTGQFLQFFGLKSLKDLPTLREFSELNEDSRRVAEAELGEIFTPQAREGSPAADLSPPSMQDEQRDTLSPATTDIPFEAGDEPDASGPSTGTAAGADPSAIATANDD